MSTRRTGHQEGYAEHDRNFLRIVASRALGGHDEDDLNHDQVEALIADALPEAFEQAAKTLVATLDKQAPRQLRHMRRQQRGFERRLRRHWGSALDQYRILWVCMQEQGSTFNHRRGPEDDPLGSALVGLHAKACRVAFEVHTLLSAGLGMGALARCRTLHEMAVLTAILTEWHGPGPIRIPDLAERFAARAAVIAHKDALEYQRNAAALNAEPFTDSEIDDLSQARKQAEAEYGAFISKKDYGWAKGVTGKREPTFADLENASGLSHLRSYYKWASHEVHADAHGVAANVINHGQGQLLLVGPSDSGLGDPGQAALISLHQITTTMLVSGGHAPGPTALMGLQAVESMLDRAREEFADAEHALHATGERAQRRIQYTQRVRTTVRAGFNRLRR